MAAVKSALVTQSELGTTFSFRGPRAKAEASVSFRRGYGAMVGTILILLGASIVLYGAWAIRVEAWTVAKRLFAKSSLFNQIFGEVVFETPEVKGASSHSFLQWRVKKGVSSKQYFVALRMRPDAYAGPEGSPTNYMSFDIETAVSLKSNLDKCISEYYRLADDAAGK